MTERLYQISERYRSALEGMLDSDELTEEVIKDTLEGIQGEGKEKCLAVAAVIKNLESMIGPMKEAEKNLKERRMAKEKQVDSLKNSLRDNMGSMDIKKIESPELMISLGKASKVLVIDDEKLLPKSALNTKLVTTVDKDVVKQLIAQGYDGKGAHFEDGKRRLSIK